MKIKLSVTYDGGKVEMTKDGDKDVFIAGSGEYDFELETLLLDIISQIWKRHQVKAKAERDRNRAKLEKIYNERRGIR